jgi:hypothetical protein
MRPLTTHDLIATPSRTLRQVWYVRRRSKPWRVLATVLGAPARGEFWIDQRGHPQIIIRSRDIADAVRAVQLQHRRT